MLIAIFGVLTALVLAYWNGANDVSKTIATIVGGRVSNYKRAVIVGALFNAIGTFLALFFAQAIFKVFTIGILTSQPNQIFAVSVIIGAILWLVLSTNIGMPVSTTHSILGAIVFLGVYVFSLKGILWNNVLIKVFLPLLLSPIISFMLAYAVLDFYSKDYCPKNKFIKVNHAHWLSCGASSFARGMNDGPKFVALAAIFIISSQISTNFLITTAIFLAVGIAMGVGGIVNGMKVTNTLSYKITKMNHVDGFIANIITTLLITSGAYLGLPMSTTHVSSSAIIGMGIKKDNHSVNWSTIKHMLSAWIITMPLSGLFSILSYIALKVIGI